MPGAPPPLKQRFYPEVGVGGFSRADAAIEFYTRVAALLRPTDRVLDFGAGRGAQIDTDQVPYRRGLKLLKGRAAHVEGCDVDPAVLANPHLDHAVVIAPDAPLPFDGASFDLVVANWVFEHIEEPARVASELLRVVKPGGYICAMTSNKWSYFAVISRLLGNASHVPLLKRVQPDRREVDVFPTRYRLNTPGALRRVFGAGAEVTAYRIASEPAYHFGKAPVFAALKLLHKLLPAALAPVLLVFVRKHGEEEGA